MRVPFCSVDRDFSNHDFHLAARHFRVTKRHPRSSRPEDQGLTCQTVQLATQRHPYGTVESRSRTPATTVASQLSSVWRRRRRAPVVHRPSLGLRPATSDFGALLAVGFGKFVEEVGGASGQVGSLLELAARFGAAVAS